MDKATAFINNILSHGETPYNPVKAREYYLRTRELKGRAAGAGKKPNVLDAKVRAKLTALSQRHRAEAKTIANEVKVRLAKADVSHKASIAGLKKYQAEETKRLSDESFRKLGALPKIPTGIGPARRAQLGERRAADIERIKGELNTKVNKLNANVEADLVGGQKEIDDNRKEVLGEATAKLAQVLTNINKDRALVLSQAKTR